MKSFEIINNEKEMQFQIHAEGEVASLQYRFYKSDIALMHTDVPDALSGKGMASALAHHALEWAKEHKKKIMVYCPFVASYLKKNPQYEELVDKSYR